jgi:hypothetical protein
MQALLQKIILLFFIVTCQYTMAQVKFSASVSAQQISKNETVQLRLLVENASEVQHITPPDLNNFILISGPNQESGMTSINGDVKRYIALSYLLKPKRPGKFNIPAASAMADGKEYKSNAVTLQVSNTLAPNNQAGNNANPFGGFNPFDDVPAPTSFNDYILRKGENAADKISRNMFVKLELDRTSCFVGEPVIATYKLYTRLKSESNMVKNPSFNGFSVIDLQQPNNMDYTREKINGREFNVYVLRKAQLYPLQSGSLELDPVEIENHVHFIKEAYANRQNDMMSDVMREFEDATIPPEGMEDEKVTLKSKPASITVKALPDAAVPASFKGAVGNFAIEAVLQKNNFTTDDAGKLDVIISGVGNLQLVNTPEISWPQGFEAFEPAATDDLVKTAVPVSGRKMITYTFTIATPGTYIIPAIRFSYFNPKEGKYKTDSTKPISFTVAKGSGKKADTASIVKTENTGFLNTFFSNRRWVISSVAILIICGLLFWLNRDAKKEARQKIEEDAKKTVQQKMEEAEVILAETNNINYLEKAGALLYGSPQDFYAELNYGLKSYLSKKLQLPVETINKKTIAEQLDKKNIAVNTAIQLQQILSDIELQLYTPFAADDKRQQLYDDTAAMIQLLDTYKS